MTKPERKKKLGKTYTLDNAVKGLNSPLEWTIPLFVFISITNEATVSTTVLWNAVSELLSETIIFNLPPCGASNFYSVSVCHGYIVTQFV